MIGDKLGLYKTLAAADAPITSGELARRTETTERSVREWLRAQAAGGYVTYHPGDVDEEEAWMVVEPFANDRVEDNFNPIGRAFYAASTMACVPCALQQEVGTALGAQAGAARLREIIAENGFSTVRLAVETPFNLILEARV